MAMNRNGVITCALGGLLLSQAATHQAMAADLSVQVNQFFQQQYPDKESQVKVVIKTPQNQWPQCDMPEITLPANARPWGNISLSVRCDGVRRFIQTQVQVSGHYAVAARQLAAGEKMTLQDIKMKQGRLDTLPPGALLEPNFAQGAVSLRQINAGQPLTRNMLRRLWIIKAGQDVQVLALGEGFNVNSNGKAMNNAAIQDNVRVRMASGQIVNGTVADDGTVHILL
ncbi:flagellar basal body P-ring biosynthesis protein FlgA [Yersinia enterocolitica subsp. palearctica YE-P4]|uniref:Flagella basal body P-ring formation protein FlgA n=2 Tax=Yersinia enterocolitica TaxID=630 RepID=A0A0H3NNV6_YERE1|nr:flagellar basal body P-ring formation chaperone FlgA [Yersinia enterocolitica]EOR82645.1 flagellar basal body P-ring biosynthesis protein FlgA [Yersinia enterocolitica subsp. palearctica YE-P4]CBY26736.1 flagellar basal-body P-ring formation protein FlgA [Yersinia enterocolitica subsp. palearctica Y11]CCO67674.1 Flagellar basal-body P-ring formation protein FlgA [Yersinia enterocolitica IP 10393]CCV61291.1 flagella basal body P-ring formation proteinFlgA [Yersinia enterocolitica (type O:2) s